MILVPIAYTIGCFCTGYYFVRLRTGQDIRLLGSGSVGAKNVLRVLGPGPAAVTAATDIGKGALVAALAHSLDSSPLVTVLGLIAVISGHIWPIQMNFRGGKGIATAGGALLVLDPLVAASWIGVYVVLLALLRKATLSGLLTVCMAPVIGLLIGRADATTMYLLSLIPIILFTHRRNIVEMTGTV